MHTVSEGQMTVGLAGEIQSIRVCKLLDIPVGRREDGENQFTTWNGRPGNDCVFASVPLLYSTPSRHRPTFR
jgi:hypothetical protein